MLHVLALIAAAVGTAAHTAWEAVQHVGPLFPHVDPDHLRDVGQPLVGMALTISQDVGDVRAIPRQGLPGMRATISDLDRARTLINKNPQAADVWTMTVSGTTAGVTYTWTINGVTDTYVSVAGDTTTTIMAASIAAKMNQNPLYRGQVKATSSSNTITLTGTYPGVAFTITESDSNLGTPSHSTTAAGADTVGFGLAVVKTGQATDIPQPAYYGALAASTLFSAQVATLAVTYAAGETYEVQITVGGVTYIVGPVAADTDSATTGAAIVSAINAMMPANTVVAAGTTSITLTAEIVGDEFGVAVGLKSGTTARLTVTNTTGPSESTSFNRAFAGVSELAQDEQAFPVSGTGIGGSTGGYPANAGVKTLCRGEIWVTNAESGVVDGDPVYVELGTSNTGQFYKASSSTRVLVTSAKWKRPAFSSSGDSIAVLEVNVPFA